MANLSLEDRNSLSSEAGFSGSWKKSGIVLAALAGCALNLAGCMRESAKAPVVDPKNEPAGTEQAVRNESSPKDEEPVKEDTFAKAVDKLISAQNKRRTKATEDMEAAQDRLAILETELGDLTTTTDHESIIQTLQEMDLVSRSMMKNAAYLKVGAIVSMDINDALVVIGRAIEVLEEPSMKAQAEAIQQSIRDRGILPFAIAAYQRLDIFLDVSRKKTAVIELEPLPDGTPASKEKLTLQEWHERQVAALKRVEEQKAATKKE